MGESEPSAVLALWIVRILVFLYDIISLPVYFLLQRPWIEWSKDSMIFGRQLKEDDPSSPVVKVIPRGRDQQQSFRFETMDQLFKNAVNKYGDRNLFGTRERLGEVEEVQKSGKVFKKLILGKYRWLTYKQANRRVENFSRGLLNLGVKPRQRIAILAETRMEWMIAAQACFRINVPVVTIYATLGDEGMVHAINETQITHLITSHDLLSKVQKILPQLPTVKCIIYMEGMESSQVQFNNTIKVRPFKDVELLGETKIPDISGESPSPEDTIIIMYTSGSTGVPKGVIISHKNMATVASALQFVFPVILPDDKYIAYLPLAHSLELTAESFFISNGIAIGYSSPQTFTDQSTAVRAQDRGDASILKPAVFMAVPLILDKICKSIMETVSSKGDFSKLLFLFFLKYKRFWIKMGFQTPITNRFIFNKVKAFLGGKVRCIGCGGAPLSAETQSFIKACMDCPTLQAYGLTETAAGATAMDLSDRSSGRIGSPLGACYIKLIDWDEGGYHVWDKPNPRGEIIIGGDSVTPGYFGKPELTKECFFEEDGIRWFHSGDIGERFPNGTFNIIDRKKDLVKLQHGEYVSLSKVETDIKTCLIVDNICVYGNSLKDYLVALIVPSKNQLNNLAKSVDKGNLLFKDQCQDPVVEAEVTKIILEHCKNKKLLRTDTPQKYKLCVDEWIPDNGLLTAAFKLKRKAIQDYYQEDIDKMYSS